MTTRFDIGRGAGSGRIGDAGSRVFVLGVDGDNTAAHLTAGDYTEVKQLVDTTEVDMLLATMETVGVAMSSYQAPAGWSDDPDVLLWWDLNVEGPRIPSHLPVGPDLLEDGQIVLAQETYSPDGENCREIISGVLTGRLLGVHTPAVITAVLNTYTLEWWLNWAGFPTVPGSTGWNPVIFEIGDANDGLVVSLLGVAGPGAHQWNVAVEHRVGGVTFTSYFPGVTLDGPSGWICFALTFDLAGGPQSILYVNGAAVGTTFAAPFPTVGIPPAASPIQYGDGVLWGQISDLRLLGRVLTPAEIATAYASCTVLPSVINLEWRMEILVDGVVWAERVIGATEQRNWTDFGVPIRSLRGPHEISFRLALAQA